MEIGLNTKQEGWEMSKIQKRVGVSKHRNGKTTPKNMRIRNWIHDSIQQIAFRRKTDFSKQTNLLLGISLFQSQLYNKFHSPVSLLKHLKKEGVTKCIIEDRVLDSHLETLDKYLQVFEWMKIVSLKKSEYKDYKDHKDHKDLKDLRWIARRLCKLLRDTFDF